MEDDLLKHLFDIKEAASAILRFARGKTFDDYEQDELLRSGVERKFEIIGEALNRIRRDNATLLNMIREHRNIVSFRDILAHGYDSIDDRIVWGIIEEDLGKLLEDVERLIEEGDRTNGCA
ncbi:MAG: HepT-like ribonuclease domain-containing protein [Pirellulaceae bacterium]